MVADVTIAVATMAEATTEVATIRTDTAILPVVRRAVEVVYKISYYVFAATNYAVPVVSMCHVVIRISLPLTVVTLDIKWYRREKRGSTSPKNL